MTQQARGAFQPIRVTTYSLLHFAPVPSVVEADFVPVFILFGNSCLQVCALVIPQVICVRDRGRETTTDGHIG